MKALTYISLFLLVFSSGTAYANSLNWFNVVEEGASKTGVLSTNILQNTIDKASEAGGGTLYFPAGNYLTGALKLKSNITLNLDAGAVLKFSDNFDDYLPFVQLRWEGTVLNSFSPLLYAKNAENITITGRGVIDGNGKAWWTEMYRIESTENLPLTKYQKMTQEQNEDIKTAPYYQRTRNFLFHRPPLFQAFQCKNILIEGVTFQNSPFWTINPAFCNNVTIDKVTIFNPPSPNTDGINPTSCKNVHISNCHISVGDDCITIKSGRDADGRKWATPTENVTITNCTMLSGHGGVVIGSEMSGGIKKITISNCVFDGTDRGIRIKAARGRGGVVEDIRVSNIVMNNIKQEAFMLNLFYDKNISEEPVSERTPIFRNIHFSNITATAVNTAGRILGITEMPVQNVSFSDINIDAKEGFLIDTALDISLADVQVATTIGSSFEIKNSKNIRLDNVSTDVPLDTKAVVKLTNVSNVFLSNNFPMVKTALFLEADGIETGTIFLKNNVFDNVSVPVKSGTDLKSKINLN
ncbi:glycoside hydrolase family 28 protein [Leeuwenhoekiella marinoflava]|uniref:glycoside hydrolase family 28 protein n=1 Tax=Leeuwenhoekiella marinoflava TaxID=988 RepID=UPI003002EEC5